nr:DUF6514 family protein [uncultured Anaerotignum sp.]
MRKAMLYKKKLQDEQGREYVLCYSLVIHATENGRVYGAEIEKTAESGQQERSLLCGVSESREETQRFIKNLWVGSALPSELDAIYDDFIGAKEWQESRGISAAC